MINFRPVENGMSYNSLGFESQMTSSHNSNKVIPVKKRTTFAAEGLRRIDSFFSKKLGSFLMDKLKAFQRGSMTSQMSQSI